MDRFKSYDTVGAGRFTAKERVFENLEYTLLYTPAYMNVSILVPTRVDGKLVSIHTITYRLTNTIFQRLTRAQGIKLFKRLENSFNGQTFTKLTELGFMEYKSVINKM